MSEEISPFVPGARVAITNRYGDDWSEGFIEKVYKTGRFVLRGSKQQWKPSPYGDEWAAWETGGGWSKRSLRIWNAATDSEISENIAKRVRKTRWQQLRSRFERLNEHELTDAMLDQVEAALPVRAKKP